MASEPDDLPLLRGEAFAGWLLGRVVIGTAAWVLLGATAAQAVLGADFRVTQHRREPISTIFARHTFATLHPAALLRIADHDLARVARDDFLLDFKVIAERHAE